MVHPFIISLKYAFQDTSCLYFMMDLVTGGELEFHLKHHGKFSVEWTRFFVAGIVLALEHLHNKNIVYRDLKPENVLLDGAGKPPLTIMMIPQCSLFCLSGYVRLADLGLCSYIQPGKSLADHCGTRSYMAPEQCTATYRFEVDWWSLGVTTYKLLTGRVRQIIAQTTHLLQWCRYVSLVSEPIFEDLARTSQERGHCFYDYD